MRGLTLDAGRMTQPPFHIVIPLPAWRQQP